MGKRNFESSSTPPPGNEILSNHMVRVFIAVAALLSLPFSLTAQELKPFDRLSKNYITLDVELGTAGAQPIGSAQTGLRPGGSASSTQDYDSIKEMVIKTPVAKHLDGLIFEAYGVYKDYGTKEVRYEKLPVQTVSEQEHRFTLATKKMIERVKYQATLVDQYGRTTPTTIDTGRAVNHGERISGWFVRAIYQNEIIGVAASTSQLQAAAGAPNPSPDGKGN